MRYAISDIHGCRKTFNALLKSINFTKKDTLYILGDFVDRGADVSGLVDDIIFMQRHGYDIVCLKGNHEEFLFDSVHNTLGMMQWLQNGGAATLESYDALSMEENWVDKIPSSHWEFYNKLLPIVVLKDYVLVHAGLDFTKDDPITETSDMMKLWMRPKHFEYDGSKVGGRYLVTGHTIQKRDFIRDLAKNKKHIFIDNGCVFTSHYNPSYEEYGTLCCLNLDTRELHFEPNREKE